jgi:hypothetical protein
MTTNAHNLFAAETSISERSVRVMAAALEAAGLEVSSDDLLTTGRACPGDVNALFVFHELALHPQHAMVCTMQQQLMDHLEISMGLRGSALYAAWAKVRGNLLVRYASGNFSKPRKSAVASWVEHSGRNDVLRAAWGKARDRIAREVNHKASKAARWRIYGA